MRNDTGRDEQALPELVSWSRDGDRGAIDHVGASSYQWHHALVQQGAQTGSVTQPPM
jgi:hypothetical protein